jgi:hypothetical protein
MSASYGSSEQPLARVGRERGLVERPEPRDGLSHLLELLGAARAIREVRTEPTPVGIPGGCRRGGR